MVVLDRFDDLLSMVWQFGKGKGIEAMMGVLSKGMGSLSFPLL